MVLTCRVFCLVALPLMLEAKALNHYGDYGLVEQSSSVNNGKLSIGNDPFGYSDEYTDSESGLQYLQVRSYDPALMRFTEMDTYPLLNRYAYANENPIMNDDPSGHSATALKSLGSAGALTGLITGVASVVIGLVSENPLAILGGISGLASLGTGTVATSNSASMSNQARLALTIASFVTGAISGGIDEETFVAYKNELDFNGGITSKEFERLHAELDITRDAQFYRTPLVKNNALVRRLAEEFGIVHEGAAADNGFAIQQRVLTDGSGIFAAPGESTQREFLSVTDGRNAKSVNITSVMRLDGNGDDAEAYIMGTNKPLSRYAVPVGPKYNSSMLASAFQETATYLRENNTQYNILRISGENCQGMASLVRKFYVKQLIKLTQPPL